MSDPNPLWRAACCFAAAAALAACASSSANLETAGPEAVRRFYEGRCGVCHVPFHPSDYPAHKWPGILAEMAPKAGLSRAQRERVLRYLTEPEEASAAR